MYKHEFKYFRILKIYCHMSLSMVEYLLLSFIIADVLFVEKIFTL